MTPRVVPLGEVCSLITDGTHYSPDDVGVGIPFLTVKDLTDEGMRFETAAHITNEEYQRAVDGNSAPQPGDVLFSKDGTIGKVHVVSEPTPFAVLSSIAILRPNVELLDSRYLGHVLRSPRVLHSATGSKTGSALTRIILKDLRRVRIPLPPPAEQRRIAVMLDRADAIRRRRRESLLLLDDFLRSAFLEIFGDPVRNENRLEVVTLGSLVTDTQYGTSAKANSDRRGRPVLRMNNITTQGWIDLSNIKWCEIAPDDVDKYTVRYGDLLFNRTNSPELVGKTAIWDGDGGYAFAGYLIRLRFDTSRALPQYVSGFLNSSYGKRMLLEKAKASNNMSNISATELKRFEIPLPPLTEQARYDRLRKKARELAARLQQAVSVNDSLFDSLSQRAFRGES